MSKNQSYIQETSALIKQYDAEKEPERLREAYLKLQAVDLQEERKAPARVQTRIAAMALWIRLLNIMDESMLPEFIPGKGISIQAEPFTASDGETYPSDTDPSTIKDPLARAEYEKAMAGHQKALETYRLQVYLSRYNEQITAAAKRFILISYAPVAADQRELTAALSHGIKQAARKEDFLKLLLKPLNGK